MTFHVNDPALMYPHLPTTLAYGAVVGISIAVGVVMAATDLVVLWRAGKRADAVRVALQTGFGLLESALWATVRAHVVGGGLGAAKPCVTVVVLCANVPYVHAAVRDGAGEGGVRSPASELLVRLFEHRMAAASALRHQRVRPCVTPETPTPPSIPSIPCTPGTLHTSHRTLSTPRIPHDTQQATHRATEPVVIRSRRLCAGHPDFLPKHPQPPYLVKPREAASCYS